MANELQYSVSITVNKGNYSEQFTPQGSVTINTLLVSSAVTPVTTTGALLDLGPVTTLGWIFGRNLDTVNYLQLGEGTGGGFAPFIKVKAGEIFAFRLAPGVPLTAQANSSTCNLQFTILND